jgi:nucleotide-binding universal stress UspA family protein/CBS domain-containing protein
MEIRNVLYPTDFSSCASTAFAVAIELARVHGARLHLLHVLDLPGAVEREPMFDMPPGEETYERLARAVETAFVPLVREAGAAGVATVTAQPRGSDVAAAIVAYARRSEIDVVVMGTHGRRGPARLLLGSLAEEVLRFGTCSLLSVRGNGAPHTPPRLLLVPFDFSAPAREALAAAAGLARRTGARLRLLHVVDADPSDESEPRAAADGRDAGTGLHDRLRGVLVELARELPAEVEVRAGRVADEIARAAAAAEVDLVVMAGEPEGGRRLLASTTAETVLRTAAAPVFLVKGEERVSAATGGRPKEESAMKVMDVMQWEPRVASSEMTLPQVARIMEEAGCGFLPVVGEGSRLLGVVTDRDVCLALARPDASAVRVRDLLRGVVWSCAAGDEVGAALRTMADRQVRRLPVLDSRGRLAGILSLDDVVAEARPQGDAGHPSFAQVMAAMQGICRHAVPASP